MTNYLSDITDHANQLAVKEYQIKVLKIISDSLTEAEKVNSQSELVKLYFKLAKDIASCQ